MVILVHVLYTFLLFLSVDFSCISCISFNSFSVCFFLSFFLVLLSFFWIVFLFRHCYRFVIFYFVFMFLSIFTFWMWHFESRLLLISYYLLCVQFYIIFVSKNKSTSKIWIANGGHSFSIFLLSQKCQHIASRDFVNVDFMNYSRYIIKKKYKE